MGQPTGKSDIKPRDNMTVGKAIIKMDAPLKAMGMMLQTRFSVEKAKRYEIEEEWLKDLRQHQGKYEANVKFNDKNSSRAFVRLTRTKVRSVDARMAELIAPMVKEAWDLEPTPEPDIPAERAIFLRQQLEPMAEEQGVVISEAHVRNLEMEYAKLAAKKMRRNMQDGMIETRFLDIARNVYHSGHKYGTGILKGPLVQRYMTKTWARLAGGEFTIIEKEKVRPFAEHTRVWDYFPEGTSASLWETDYDFQRHTFNRYQLRRMAAKESFRGGVIHAHIEANPEGDTNWERYELDIFQAGRNNPSLAVGSPNQKYEVLEYWGLVDALDLRKEGIELPEEFRGIVLEVNMWIFAKTGQVIKAVLNPFDKGTRPYSFYIPEPEEGRGFGISLPALMRDPQSLFNASIRMMVDNAASAVKPQVMLNMRRMVGNKDILNLWPGRAWFVTSEAGDQVPPIETVDMPLHTPLFQQMANQFKTLGDEGSGIPSFQHGDRSPGVGRTVGGLSMLMGAANMLIKENVRGWDECFEKFLKMLYDWYMQFGEDPMAKGDFNVNVKGTHSVMAREFKSEKLEIFAEKTLNPLDAPLIDRRELLKERAEALEIDPKVLKSQEAAEKDAQAAQEQAARGEQNGAGNGNGSAPGGENQFGSAAPTGQGQLPNQGIPQAVGAETTGEATPPG